MKNVQINYFNEVKKQKNSSDEAIVRKILKTLHQRGVEGIPIQMKPHKLRGNFKDNW